MNDNEIDRIAAAANALRPDWPTASLRTLLRMPALANRPRRDVAVALTWVACDTNSRTPARVLEHGPWWQATQADNGLTGFTPPTTAEACRLCGRHQTRCICDVGPTTRPPRRSDQHANHVEALKAAHAAATAHLCSHGVPPDHCTDHRPTTVEEPT